MKQYSGHWKKTRDLADSPGFCFRRALTGLSGPPLAVWRSRMEREWNSRWNTGVSARFSLPRRGEALALLFLLRGGLFDLQVGELRNLFFQ